MSDLSLPLHLSWLKVQATNLWLFGTLLRRKCIDNLLPGSKATLYISKCIDYLTRMTIFVIKRLEKLQRNFLWIWRGSSQETGLGWLECGVLRQKLGWFRFEEISFLELGSPG